MQTFTAPLNTTYKIECWGAQGGNATANGSICINERGLGAYTIGLIPFLKDLTVYIYVGGKGEDGVVGVHSAGGYNGGGSGAWDENDDDTGGGGGGATDVRLTGGTWDAFSSLKSRIMVAAGGGGRCERHTQPGYGGGLSGGNVYRNNEIICSGATQTSIIWGHGDNTAGKGKNNEYGYWVGLSGGGGGYYGGNASWDATESNSSYANASGGSSFISGYSGCDAIAESSTEDNIIHTGQPNHYSGKVFTNPIMIAGNASMPKPKGGTETGHSGEGYAIISWISPSL